MEQKLKRLFTECVTELNDIDTETLNNAINNNVKPEDIKE